MRTETSERSLKLREHPLPDAGGAASFPGVDDASIRIEEDEVRLIGRTELPRARPIGILHRLPRPLVARDVRSGFVRRVRDVDPDVRELGMSLDELCVGDR